MEVERGEQGADRSLRGVDLSSRSTCVSEADLSLSRTLTSLCLGHGVVSDSDQSLSRVRSVFVSIND